MIAQPFEYHAPESVSEALKLLGSLENSRVLAGGQSLIPMMKLRLSGPAHLIDLGRIAELHYIAQTNGSIRIARQPLFYVALCVLRGYVLKTAAPKVSSGHTPALGRRGPIQLIDRSGRRRPLFL